MYRPYRMTKCPQDIYAGKNVGRPWSKNRSTQSTQLMIRKTFNPLHDTLKLFFQVLSFSFFLKHQAQKKQRHVSANFFHAQDCFVPVKLNKRTKQIKQSRFSQTN